MDSAELEADGLECLNAQECYALLATVPIGRIVFTEAALPAIQPVNFAIDDADIVIRTGIGSKLAAAARSAVVAFEADSYDIEGLTGWSVVLIGRAKAVADSTELERLHQLALTPWALGVRPHYIRIVPEIVRGRRIRSSVTAI